MIRSAIAVFFTTLMVVGCSARVDHIRVLDQNGEPISGVKVWPPPMFQIGSSPKSNHKGRIGLIKFPVILDREGFVPVIVESSDADNGLVVLEQEAVSRTSFERGQYLNGLYRQMRENSN